MGSVKNERLSSCCDDSSRLAFPSSTSGGVVVAVAVAVAVDLIRLRNMVELKLVGQIIIIMLEVEVVFSISRIEIYEKNGNDQLRF